MSHANARLTPRGRLLTVHRAQAGWPKARIAKAMGVSLKCVTTWITRYREEGETGLVDRSSRPHSSPAKTPAGVEAEVLRVRTAERSGRDGAAERTGVPARTVSRILARNGSPRLATLDPITGEVIRSSKSTAVRYERDRPGELVHMDVKKFEKIPDGGGWRALGSDVADGHRDVKIGYDYVHSLVDDHSRLAYSETLDDEKGPTCAGSSSARSRTSPRTESSASNG